MHPMTKVTWAVLEADLQLLQQWLNAWAGAHDNDIKVTHRIAAKLHRLGE